MKRRCWREEEEEKEIIAFAQADGEWSTCIAIYISKLDAGLPSSHTDRENKRLFHHRMFWPGIMIRDAWLLFSITVICAEEDGNKTTLKSTAHESAAGHWRSTSVSNDEQLISDVDRVREGGETMCQIVFVSPLFDDIMQVSCRNARGNS